MTLRVLYVNPGRDLGGAEQSLLLLLEALRARDVDPTVALFGDGPFAARLSSLGIPTAYLKLPDAVRRTSRYGTSQDLAGTARLAIGALPSVVRLSLLARRLHADIIHTNGLKAHLLGGLAGRLARRPVVWHLRDFPPAGVPGRLFRAAARSLPALVFANSEAVAAAIRGANVVRLYNPVDLRRFRPDRPGGGDGIRRELGVPDDAPLVGMVAHLTPWKGHEQFLRIALALADAVPGIRFLVAGGAIYETEGHSGYADSLKRRAVDLGLGGRVAFLGARDDVPDILAATDVLVHCPTAPEPFGRVLAEAMAAGRPVVAARAGGIPEIVEHEVTGLLVATGDVHRFAAAVLRLLADPGLRGRLGDAARRRAESLFAP